MSQPQPSSPSRYLARLGTDGGATPPTTADRLLAMAADLFRSKGYASATTRELSGLLGIKKASLYHHISGKEELLYAICMESLRHIRGQVGAVAETTASEQRLRAMIERHVVSALNDRDMHFVMLVELRALSAEHLAEVVEQRDAYEALLRHAIETDQRAGRVRGDHDAKYLTLALLNVLNWTIFWFDPDGDRTPEDLGVLLADVFLSGARGPAAA
jgi:TetR/AcrR family transcriptional regulator, cholesterol catabolism regulator